MEENNLNMIETTEIIEEVTKNDSHALKNVVFGMGVAAGIYGIGKGINWAVNCIKNRIAESKAKKADDNKNACVKEPAASGDEEFDIEKDIDAE